MTVAYPPNVVVLDRLEWAIRPGEKWAVVGGNGSGKSTVVELITGTNLQGLVPSTKTKTKTRFQRCFLFAHHSINLLGFVASTPQLLPSPLVYIFGALALFSSSFMLRRVRSLAV